jgi:alpha-glucosidase
MWWRDAVVLAEAFGDVMRFWLDRGIDGFRLDAIDRLVKDAEFRDDPPASAPFALPLREEYGEL